MVNTKPYPDFFSSASKFQAKLPLGRIVLCLLLLSAIIACDKISNFFKPYVATVNGSKIYLEDYQSQLDQKMRMVPKDFLNQPEYLKRFEEEVLDDMITEKIMSLRAQELNISISDPELEQKIKEIRKDYGEDFTGQFARENIKYEQWKEDFKKEMLWQKLIVTDVNAKIKITEDEAEDYFNQRRNNYKTEARVRVAQIVVHDQAKAQEALKRLNSGEDFAKVAADLSIGPEARRGGDLGFITKWVMPDPLDKTIFSMPINKISPVVQSSYGFHIFKVLASQPAGVRKFAEVREDVLADIRLQKEDAAFVSWLAELKKKAVIKKQTNIQVKGLSQ